MNQGHKGHVYSKHQATHTTHATIHRLVIDAQLHGQPWGQWTLDDASAFRVGWGRGSHVPLGPHHVPEPTFALAEVKDGACHFHVTTAMSAVMRAGTRQDVCAEGMVALQRDAEARIACGAFTFQLAWLPPPPVVGKPRRRAWSSHWPALVSVLGLLCVLGVVWLVPADQMALTGWDSQRMVHLLAATTIPVVLPKEDAIADLHANKTLPTAKGTPRKTKTDPRANSKPSKSATTPIPKESVSPENVGMVAILHDLGRLKGTIASVLAGPTADGLGDALSNLQAPSLAGAFDIGGLGVSLDAGPAGPTLGDGRLETIGTCGKGKPCRDEGRQYARHAGLLGPRKQPRGPEVSVAPCAPGSVGCGAHGALDKEVVRREIRKRINEIKFCYEQQLVHIPSLAGRVAVRFIIAPTGSVAASIIAESSLGNVRVESCVAKAIARWQFPVAARAGTTIVTYPFAFAPVGT